MSKYADGKANRVKIGETAPVGSVSPLFALKNRSVYSDFTLTETVSNANRLNIYTSIDRFHKKAKIDFRFSLFRKMNLFTVSSKTFWVGLKRVMISEGLLWTFCDGTLSFLHHIVEFVFKIIPTSFAELLICRIIQIFQKSFYHSKPILFNLTTTMFTVYNIIGGVMRKSISMC